LGILAILACFSKSVQKAWCFFKVLGHFGIFDKSDKNPKFDFWTILETLFGVLLLFDPNFLLKGGSVGVFPEGFISEVH
jgi:hypothetical protein